METVDVEVKGRRIKLEIDLSTTTWRPAMEENPPPRSPRLLIVSEKGLTLAQARQLRLELGRAIRLVERRSR